jgi:hypothetical protein
MANRQNVGFMATTNDSYNKVIFSRYSISTDIAFFVRRGFITPEVRSQFSDTSDHSVVKAIELIHTIMVSQAELRNYMNIVLNPN